jgi:hypothetical protein
MNENFPNLVAHVHTYMVVGKCGSRGLDNVLPTYVEVFLFLYFVLFFC